MGSMGSGELEIANRYQQKGQRPVAKHDREPAPHQGQMSGLERIRFAIEPGTRRRSRSS